MLTDAFHEALMGAVVGDDHAPTFPDVWFLAFYDENGDELTEAGYQRVAVPNTSQVWEIDGATATNLDPIDAGTPEEAWPDIHFVGLLDDTGTPVFYTPLDDPYGPIEGQAVSLDAGGLTVSLGLEEE